MVGYLLTHHLHIEGSSPSYLEGFRLTSCRYLLGSSHLTVANSGKNYYQKIFI